MVLKSNCCFFLDLDGIVVRAAINCCYQINFHDFLLTVVNTSSASWRMAIFDQLNFWKTRILVGLWTVADGWVRNNVGKRFLEKIDVQSLILEKSPAECLFLRRQLQFAWQKSGKATMIIHWLSCSSRLLPRLGLRLFIKKYIDTSAADGRGQIWEKGRTAFNHEGCPQYVCSVLHKQTRTRKIAKKEDPEVVKLAKNNYNLFDNAGEEAP